LSTNRLEVAKNGCALKLQAGKFSWFHGT